VMTKLIEKNTTIPAQASQAFSTAEDNQSAVTVHVLQGEREQATYNKSLGQFNLEGINPAPRGMPQIEVKFDIDANGILNVSARDQVTGKEQSVVIKASSGLSDDEIERMVREAEAHADEDRRFHELVSARNQAEALIHTSRQSLNEAGDKLDSSQKSEVETAIAGLETAIQGDNREDIEARTQQLSEASARLAEHRKAGNAGSQAGAAGSAKTAEEDVIDAEFTEDDQNQNNAA